jgi:glycosyltransferase involved in cell wall biosynthesis
MLSVITITYNNFTELKATLDSLKDRPLESIVINGGNCPETKSFLESFTGSSLSESDEGISDAFNKGLDLSTGAYVTFLNSGDILIDTSYYSEALNIFKTRPEIDFVYADIEFNDIYAGPIRVNSGKTLPHMPFVHPTLIVRRDLFKKIGEFDVSLKIAMDLDFVYRMLRLGSRGQHIPRMVVRMDGTGISSTNPIAVFREIFFVILKNKDFSLRSFFFLLTKGIALFFKLLILAFKGESILRLYRIRKYGFKSKG